MTLTTRNKAAARDETRLAPQRFHLGRMRSPLGEMLLITDDAERLVAVDFADYEDRMHRLLRAQHRHGGGYTLHDGEVPAAIREGFEAYFGGEFAAIDRLDVNPGGTEFQREMWTTLRQLPAGGTTSYGAFAARLGKPQATRAVGAANGANPIAIVVPCHRLVGADTSLTGYGGGLARKAWLLRHEGAPFKALPD